jgi:rod shape-determining protein MreB
VFSKYIGIDLGTANVLVYVKGRGIVLNEPSVVAYSSADNRVIAVGSHARQMLGRTPGRINVARPMRDGVIADYLVTEAMLRYFISKVVGKYSLFRPVVMVCIPAGVTNVESRAVLDATIQAGAKEAHLIAEPLAAAIGSNVPISSPSGNMVVDIGGGTCEAAVISLNDIVVSESVRVGGNKIDEMISTYVRKKYNLHIGDRTAEDIKVAIGSALPLERELEVEIRGRDTIDGLPKTRVITSHEVTEAISDALAQIVSNVRTVLEQTPPELAADVADKGMILTGGGALLRNLDKMLSVQTGVPAYVADDPLSCVAIGAGRALEHFTIFKDSLTPV